jgi:hypothetical protein
MSLEFTLAGKTKVIPPSAVSGGRYKYMSLAEAEPNLGLPSGTGVFFLTGDQFGSRGWTQNEVFDFIDAIEIDTLFLNADQIYTVFLSAFSGKIDNFESLSAYIDESYIKSLTAQDIKVDRLDIKELFVESLTALSAYIDFLDVNHTTGFLVNGNLEVVENVSVSGNLTVIENITANDAFFDILEANHIKAVTKSFLVNHPTKKDKKLHYGSLESPYHGIRLTGKGTVIKGIGVVELPEYISNFVLEEDVNIQLTNYKHNKLLYVDTIDISQNKFTVKLDGWFNKLQNYEFFWSLTAIRKDVEKLLVEE